MKSKTKRILIFAAILAAAFLIAFLDGGAVQSAADEEEEGTLIGAFVSEEDLDIGGDLAVSAAGKFVWKAGRLYMDTDEDWWALKDRGSGIYCTMEPDARYGEEDAKSPNIRISAHSVRRWGRPVSTMTTASVRRTSTSRARSTPAATDK